MITIKLVLFFWQFWELSYLETMDGVPVLLTWSSLSESKVWEVVIFCWTSELVWKLFEVAATDDIAVSCERKISIFDLNILIFGHLDGYRYESRNESSEMLEIRAPKSDFPDQGVLFNYEATALGSDQRPPTLKSTLQFWRSGKWSFWCSRFGSLEQLHLDFPITVTIQLHGPSK